MMEKSPNQSIPECINPELFLESDEDPLKNVFCPYYDKCLDIAIKEKWCQFTCKFCNYQKLHIVIRPDMLEMLGYWRLLNRIFFKRDYQI